jgi:NAD(P)-dependent dehydrogenase (short-subunit alcohol dehydrogenase family)
MTTHILSLEGTTAVVIGGTSGVGRSLSLGVAAAGADGIASARRYEQVDETAAEIEGQREAGPQARTTADRGRLWRGYGEVAVLDRHVPLHLVDLNGENSAGTGDGPAERGLATAFVTIIRVIDLCGIEA